MNLFGQLFIFTLSYSIVFDYYVVCRISDKRRCVDADCSVPISIAKTMLRYNADDSRLLSFPPNVLATVYSKEAGDNPSLWEAVADNSKICINDNYQGSLQHFYDLCESIRGKRGYVPKGLLREHKMLVKPNEVKFIVSTGRDGNQKQNVTQEVEDKQLSKPENLHRTPALTVANTKGLFSMIGGVSADSVPPSSPDISPQTTKKYTIFDGTTLYDDPGSEHFDSSPEILSETMETPSIPNVPLLNKHKTVENVLPEVSSSESVQSVVESENIGGVKSERSIEESEEDLKTSSNAKIDTQHDSNIAKSVGSTSEPGLFSTIVNGVSNLINSGKGAIENEEIEEEEGDRHEESSGEGENSEDEGDLIEDNNVIEPTLSEENGKRIDARSTSNMPENELQIEKGNLSPAQTVPENVSNLPSLINVFSENVSMNPKPDDTVTNLESDKVVQRELENDTRSVIASGDKTGISNEKVELTENLEGPSKENIAESTHLRDYLQGKKLEKSKELELSELGPSKNIVSESAEEKPELFDVSTSDITVTESLEGKSETPALSELTTVTDSTIETKSILGKDPSQKITVETSESANVLYQLTEPLHKSEKKEIISDSTVVTPSSIEPLPKSEKEEMISDSTVLTPSPTEPLPKSENEEMISDSTVVTPSPNIPSETNDLNIHEPVSQSSSEGSEVKPYFETATEESEIKPVSEDTGIPQPIVSEQGQEVVFVSDEKKDNSEQPESASPESEQDPEREIVDTKEKIGTSVPETSSTHGITPRPLLLDQPLYSAVSKETIDSSYDEVSESENNVISEETTETATSVESQGSSVSDILLNQEDGVTTQLPKEDFDKVTISPKETSPHSEDISTPVQEMEDITTQLTSDESSEGMFSWFNQFTNLFSSSDSSQFTIEDFKSDEMLPKSESLDPSQTSYITDETCVADGLGEPACGTFKDGAVPRDVAWTESLYYTDMSATLELLDKIPMETTIWLIITAVVVLIFSLGHYYIEAHRRDGPLVAVINKLEREVLILKKESCILEDRLNTAHQQVEAWNTSSSENDALIVELKQELDETKAAKSELEEQVALLEREVETVTESGLEMHRLLSESLSSQDGSQVLLSTVETLREKLEHQEDEIAGLSESLSHKNMEVEELQEKLARAAEVASSLEDRIVFITRDKEEEVLQLKDKHRQLVAQLEEAMETKALDETRVSTEMSKLRLTIEDLQKSLAGKDSELEELKEVVKQLRSTDSNDKMDALFDVVGVRAKLHTAVTERDEFREKFLEEEGARKLLEGHMKKITQEVAELKNSFETAERDKIEALTKLQVLSNYFKEKESQLQKELGLQESMWLQKQSDDHTIYEQMRSLREENEKYKLQNESLKKEIVEQESSFKIQLANVEQKSHENWVASRQAERRVKEVQQEAAQLRNRLTMEKNSANYSLDDGKQNISESNGDPSSPPPSLMFPPTTSPPFMMYPMPPPGDFVPPPPFMGSPYPSDSRPPPLGRISSPPLDHRFSPPPPLPYPPYDYPTYGHHSPSPPPPMPPHHRNVHKPQPREMSRDQKDIVMSNFSPEADKTTRRNKR